ncbi:hypothetical protein LJC42_02720 [Eubacteriales bacterium OttesenSCG-928-K08]|nr:hypothetical protein [Eubacteriales bacterium OttesenSCG-928-K08]
MFGMVLCFVLPGVLVGILLSTATQEAKKRARIHKMKRAHSTKKNLYIHDMQADHSPSNRPNAA